MCFKILNFFQCKSVFLPSNLLYIHFVVLVVVLLLVGGSLLMFNKMTLGGAHYFK
jgi:hypothetical protein